MKGLKFIIPIVILLFFRGVEPPQLPPLNQKIVDYIETVIGKKVDRGECWDLANRALRHANAKWNGAYEFGKLIDYKKDLVLPGDIIQFSKVTVTFEKNNGVYMETYPHHTAIIYKSLDGDNNFKIAHQNNGYSKRTVGVSELNFNNITKGKIKVYRATK